MAAIAEYPSRWEAEVAAARLREAGYEAAVLAEAWEANSQDTSYCLAAVVVRAEVADLAAGVLGLERPDIEAEHLDAAFYQRRFADRPAWVRHLTWIVFIAIPGPLIVVGLVLLWTVLQGIFP